MVVASDIVGSGRPITPTTAAAIPPLPPAAPAAHNPRILINNLTERLFELPGYLYKTT